MILRKLLSRCYLTQLRPRVILRTGCSPLATAPAAKVWEVAVAVCLERYPVVSPPMTNLEKDFSELLMKIEQENSLLSDHEVHHREDLKRLKRKSQDDDATTGEGERIQTAQDFEDAANAELKQFVAAERIVEPESQPSKSLKRVLDRKLVLLVKQKLGQRPEWMLPTAFWKAGETLRQTSERCLREAVALSDAAQKKDASERESFTVIGNAPFGFYPYKYPKPVVQLTKANGCKVFFFKAQTSARSWAFNCRTLSKQIEDHLWLTHDELSRYLPPFYLSRVQQFLLE